MKRFIHVKGSSITTPLGGREEKEGRGGVTRSLSLNKGTGENMPSVRRSLFLLALFPPPPPCIFWRFSPSPRPLLLAPFFCLWRRAVGSSPRSTQKSLPPYTSYCYRVRGRPKRTCLPARCGHRRQRTPSCVYAHSGPSPKRATS